MKANENEVFSELKKTRTQNFQKQQSNNLNNYSGLLNSAEGFLLASSYQGLLELDKIEEIEEKSDFVRLRAQAGERFGGQPKLNFKLIPIPFFIGEISGWNERFRFRPYLNRTLSLFCSINLNPTIRSYTKSPKIIAMPVNIKNPPLPALSF